MHANARPLAVSVVLCAHASLFIVVVHVHYLGACGSVLSTLLILSVRVSKRPYKRAANRRKRYLQMIFARFFTRFEGRFDFLKSPKRQHPHDETILDRAPDRPRRDAHSLVVERSVRHAVQHHRLADPAILYFSVVIGEN